MAAPLSTPEAIARLREMHEAGLSWREIGEAFGYAGGSHVYNVAKRLGMLKPPAGSRQRPWEWRPPTAAELAAFATEDPAVTEAVRFMRSRDVVVLRMAGGLYRLNNRETLAAAELLDRANRRREYLGMAPIGRAA